MNPSVTWALVVATWREKLSRPLMIAIFGLLCFSQTIYSVTSSHELEDPVLILTLMIGAGCVGREVSSGVLALLFTRPFARSNYVVAKWLATGAAAGTLSAVTLLVQAVLLARGGAGVPAADVGAALFEAYTTAFGVSAPLVLFSTLVAGFGDVAVWSALAVIGSVIQRRVPLRFAEEWRAALQPELHLGATWFATFSYLSTVTLCLCLAALVVNRKELSYAAG